MATKTPSKPKKPAAGRRKGSKRIQRDEVDVVVSTCKQCHSTRRTAYGKPQVLDHSGVNPITGRPFNRVVWRRTQCLDCGQHRIDKCYEHHSPLKLVKASA